MKDHRTKGLIAAPPTGFGADGGVDIGVVKPLAEHLGSQGVIGVFVNGTTGEGMSLTTAEREALAAEWRRVLPAGIKLFVHAGHHCQVEAIRLARHAQSIGADAVAVIAHYSKYLAAPAHPPDLSDPSDLSDQTAQTKAQEQHD